MPTAAAACATGSLRLNARVTGAAAGTDYVSLVVTNTGDSPCRLFGYPGASFLDGQGNQVGLAASRDKSATPHPVVVDPGDKAHAVLSFPNPGVFGSGCGQRQAKAVRMYPPDQTAALVAALKVSVCTDRQGRASVGSMRPGTRG